MITFKKILNQSIFKSHISQVEFLSLGRITGWVFDKNVELVDLRLIIGNKIISQTLINKERPDVCEEFNYKGTPGFELDLPKEIDNIDKTSKISLIALSADGKKKNS